MAIFVATSTTSPAIRRLYGAIRRRCRIDLELCTVPPVRSGGKSKSAGVIKASRDADDLGQKVRGQESRTELADVLDIDLRRAMVDQMCYLLGRKRLALVLESALGGRDLDPDPDTLGACRVARVLKSSRI